MANEVVLVVEDDRKSRKLVRDLLTFKGYEIHV
jgi:CheY-like chemotaxis protein